MTETAPDTATKSCTRSQCILTGITWLLLLICIGAWMTYATALLPTLAPALFLTGIISGSLFLLFFIAQIVG